MGSITIRPVHGIRHRFLLLLKLLLEQTSICGASRRIVPTNRLCVSDFRVFSHLQVCIESDEANQPCRRPHVRALSCLLVCSYRRLALMYVDRRRRLRCDALTLPVLVPDASYTLLECDTTVAAERVTRLYWKRIDAMPVVEQLSAGDVTGSGRRVNRRKTSDK